MTEIRPQSLPSAYLNLGVKTGYDPVKANEVRMFIIGPPGGGKTTFVSSSPRTLILDFEKGASGIPNTKAHRLYVKNKEQLDAIVSQLEADGASKNRPFDRVVIDTIDQLLEVMNAPLSLQYDCVDITMYGSHGAGYSILRNATWDYIGRLERAGYAWTVVGHLTEKSIVVGKAERTVLRPVLFNSFAHQIMRNSELSCMISPVSHTVPKYLVKTVKGQKIKVRSGDETVTRVVLNVANTPEFGSKVSKRRGVPTMRTQIDLPEYLDAKTGWGVFKEAYDEAIASIKTKIGM